MNDECVNSENTFEFGGFNMGNAGDKVIVSGFGETAANGTYDYVNEYNGQSYYEKGDYLLLYTSKYGEWSQSEGYYICKKFQIQGAAPIVKPLYRVQGSSVSSSNVWSSLRDITSGETTVGTTTLDDESSSSEGYTSSSSESEGNVSSSSSSE